MKITVAAASLNQTPLAWEENRRNIVDAIKEAEKQGASLVCLPELCVSGYNCEDVFLSPALRMTAMEMALSLAPLSQLISFVVGLPVDFEGAIYNCAAVFAQGKLQGLIPKQNLAGQGLHYEPRWFKPWVRGKRTQLTFSGTAYPIGDYLFESKGFAFGFEICEDAWVSDRPGKKLGERGADLILNPSASHFAFGKFKQRQDFVIQGSKDFDVAYVYTNLSGNESGRAIYDGGAIIAHQGEIQALGPRLFYSQYQVTAATLDFKLKPKPSNEGVIRLELPSGKEILTQKAEAPWEDSEQLKSEELTRSIALGLYDYLRKSKSKGFVLSLSGGADSSAVACLIHYMVHFAWAELGQKQFLKTMGLSPVQSPDEAVRKLLTCVYQGTENSSEVTRTSAREVARNVGADYFEFEINALVKEYVEMAEKGLGQPLNWKDHNLPLQNIQARVRSPGIWLVANVKGALLITTCNRSEIAVGYSTMDGDTSGGLAPLAGIDKAYIRHFLRWLEKVGPEGSHPIPALSYVNHQEPTAELKPPEEKQTDERDLMPYDVLDRIERTAIRDRLSPLETYVKLRPEMQAYSRDQFAGWVEKFFRMFAQSQWKRERNAPSFHLDDESLDPKTWYRFPILSGGYQRELEQLREYVKGETHA